MKLDNRPLVLACLLSLFFAVMLCGCDQDKPKRQQTAALQQKKNAAPLSIVSGSENKTLEPLLQQFARKNGINISMQYMGSVDIAHEIAKGTASQFDAVWPASGLWLSLGDKQGVVRHAQSIMRSPVVFAVKKYRRKTGLGQEGSQGHGYP